MSRRRTRRPPDTALQHQICSLLLRYPAEAGTAPLDDVRAALPAIADSRVRTHLSTFVRWLESVSPNAAARHYVATFDHTRRRSLYLTYYRHGDTRARGMALLALKHIYRGAGLEPPDTELPDYLPLLLEFAALAPEAGHRVLNQCRAGLELLRQGLHDVASPYGALVDAVAVPFPALPGRQRTELRRLAADGPPSEEVGLEPFAPPEYLTGGRL